MAQDVIDCVVWASEPSTKSAHCRGTCWDLHVQALGFELIAFPTAQIWEHMADALEAIGPFDFFSVINIGDRHGAASVTGHLHGRQCVPSL